MASSDRFRSESIQDVTRRQPPRLDVPDGQVAAPDGPAFTACSSRFSDGAVVDDAQHQCRHGIRRPFDEPATFEQKRSLQRGCGKRLRCRQHRGIVTLPYTATGCLLLTTSVLVSARAETHKRHQIGLFRLVRASYSRTEVEKLHRVFQRQQPGHRVNRAGCP